ncbi:hypothetical protein JAAARDRAFT_53698 [Jaapia argillacea MUCL 33604]|uniref:Uncharacterized protein n=1 Tax=Jaapia argillacea MUCL 33604 TaxID=933084 RepID=A0A067Q973_9AGAM|nr:hypothetical protein JAAARDRAFT_53698 [Jaapia argillacea MUCL 33604]
MQCDESSNAREAVFVMWRKRMDSLARPSQPPSPSPSTPPSQSLPSPCISLSPSRSSPSPSCRSQTPSWSSPSPSPSPSSSPPLRHSSSSLNITRPKQNSEASCGRSSWKNPPGRTIYSPYGNAAAARRVKRESSCSSRTSNSSRASSYSSVSSRSSAGPTTPPPERMWEDDIPTVVKNEVRQGEGIPFDRAFSTDRRVETFGQVDHVENTMSLPIMVVSRCSSTLGSGRWTATDRRAADEMFEMYIDKGAYGNL